jgi:hypothetical protein
VFGPCALTVEAKGPPRCISMYLFSFGDVVARVLVGVCLDSLLPHLVL